MFQHSSWILMGKTQVVYLVGSIGCQLSWITETEWNYHWGSLSNIIHKIKKTEKQHGSCYFRHDKIILLHHNTCPYVMMQVKTYVETVDKFYPTAHPSDVHLFRSIKIIWRYQKLNRFVASLKRWSVLLAHSPYAVKKMETSRAYWRTILSIKHKTSFFHNKGSIFHKKQWKLTFKL